MCYNNYKKDLWYIIWADVKLSTKTFDLYVDDKKVKSDIPLPKDAAAVDRFSVTGGNGAPVYLTGIQVYPTETFDDYVPEPTVKAKMLISECSISDFGTKADTSVGIG